MGSEVQEYKKLHERLTDLQVKLSPDPTLYALRALFSEIRTNRNMVARVIGKVIPVLVGDRAMLLRKDRVIDAVGNATLNSRDGFLGCSNEAQRKARLKVIQAEDYDERAVIKERILHAEELVSHAKLVRDELRFAFEEASRSLASLDLEHKIETNRS